MHSYQAEVGRLMTEAREKEAEIARLRSENAELRRMLEMDGFAPAVIDARLALAAEQPSGPAR